MRQLRSRLLCQLILAIMALTLILHLADGTKNSTKKNKRSKNKRGQMCIWVRWDRSINDEVEVSGIRNFRNRSIVPFDYKQVDVPDVYPSPIFEFVCGKTCNGSNLNVVSIRRQIPYLRREGSGFVLAQRMVTVGCTCVYAEVREQPTK